ncbi:MAG: PilZ domain-containing protein [Thermoanaerobaculia bacterium]
MGESGEVGARRVESADAPGRVLRRILTVGVEPELYARIEALLNRSYFEVDKVPRGESGRVLCAAIAFDLLLVRYPLPDMEVPELLAAVRSPGSLSSGSQVVLLAEALDLPYALSLVGAGADKAMAADETGEIVGAVAARLLHVAPRVASRVMVRLQARLGDGERQALCQTGDLSSSGFFVRTDERYPLGSNLSFQLQLPGERDAVSGSATVVRFAQDGPGRFAGIGLRYVDFRDSSEARLRAFLDRAT